MPVTQLQVPRLLRIVFVINSTWYWTRHLYTCKLVCRPLHHERGIYILTYISAPDFLGWTLWPWRIFVTINFGTFFDPLSEGSVGTFYSCSPHYFRNLIKWDKARLSMPNLNLNERLHSLVAPPHFRIFFTLFRLLNEHLTSEVPKLIDEPWWTWWLPWWTNVKSSLYVCSSRSGDLKQTVIIRVTWLWLFVRTICAIRLSVISFTIFFYAVPRPE